MIIQRARGRFPGGVVMPHRKRLSTHGKIESLPLPAQLILPLSQHLGAPAKSLVEPGQQVCKGELIAMPQGQISAAIHAPTSGVIHNIEPRPVPQPSGQNAMSIVLDADGHDRWRPRNPDPHPLEQPASRMVERLRRAGVAGLGGAVFPTHAKLARSVETLIINGAECEPYIACDEMLILERAAEIIWGAMLLRHTLGARRCIIAVEDHRAETRKALHQALLDSGLDECIDLRLVPSRYPEGGERQLIQVLTGWEVPAQGLPQDIGLLCLNVGTAAAAWRAIRYDEPLFSRVVTVTGPGIRRPGNFQVLLGTPIKELVAACGGYTPQATRLVMGGPMMGLALPHDDHPVVKACNCVLVLSRSDVETMFPEMPCIRCMACVDCCPAGLLPQQLFWHIQADKLQRARMLAVEDCIECGCCAQVCPSHIPLVDYYRYAKSALAQRDEAGRRADAARHRFEQRSARVNRAEQARTARLQRRDALLSTSSSGDRKAEIAAAVARVRAQRKPVTDEKQ